MAETGNSGSSMGKGLKRGLFIITAIAVSILLMSLGFDFRESKNELTEKATVMQARSGMYRMRDVTAGTEEVVQMDFSKKKLEYLYPLILDSGRRITITVGGTTKDGVNYTLCRKREDENPAPNIPKGCYFKGYDPRPCTFEDQSGTCLIPDGRGSTNRVEYTKL